MSAAEDSLAADFVDRYRSFKGIDFDGQASRMLERIDSHTREANDLFWTYFNQRRHATEGARCDDLLLLAKVADNAHSWIFAQGQGENYGGQPVPVRSTAQV